MLLPRIIAFSGPKYSGKDTAASILFRQNETPGYANSFLRMPFAWGTKTICSLAFGYPEGLLEDPVLKETPTEDWPHIAPRWPMMDVANWFRDKYGEDIWVRVNKRRIIEQHAANPYWAYVITDWRFPQETTWLKAMNALRIYISRPSAEEQLHEAQKAGDAMALNPSEMHYASTREAATHIIKNDAEPYKMHNQVLSAVRNHFGFWHPEGGIK